MFVGRFDPRNLFGARSPLDCIEDPTRPIWVSLETLSNLKTASSAPIWPQSRELGQCRVVVGQSAVRVIPRMAEQEPEAASLGRCHQRDRRRGQPIVHHHWKIRAETWLHSVPPRESCAMGARNLTPPPCEG